MRLFFFLSFFSMCPLLLVAQDTASIVDAWDPQEINFIRRDTPKPLSIFTDISNSLISFYQKEISTGSVSRCPFTISCSVFCQRAINRYGIFGIPLFIDRYFYRENIDSFSHYKLIQIKNGVLKLDDELFLFIEKK
jgi:hypothetical protein